MQTLVVHFVRFGPYHLARLKSAREAFPVGDWQVVGLEISANDSTYDWREEDAGGHEKVTVFKDAVYESISAADLAAGVHAELDRLKPAAVAIAGWGSVDARACLSWCRKNGAKAIVMSETRKADGVRVWWKELLKSRLIRRFDGALVGGESHRDYLVGLGMARGKIHLGYNVVDNGYFTSEAAGWRGRREIGDWRPEAGGKSEVGSRKSEVGGHGKEVSEALNSPSNDQLPTSPTSSLSTLNHLPSTSSASPPSTINDQRSTSPQSTINHQPSTPSRPYFLASNRFIGRKNLARLVDAFAVSSGGWDLCLMGDGELREELISQCGERGLAVIAAAPWEGGIPTDPAQPAVFFPGFCQIDELPRFYALAGCFVHPALEEPWGLVINEAMACGLPILSSDNVGAAEELVVDGINGWRFDPRNTEAISTAMRRVTDLSDAGRRALGAASSILLEKNGTTAAFGAGLRDAVRTAGV